MSTENKPTIGHAAFVPHDGAAKTFTSGHGFIRMISWEQHERELERANREVAALRAFAQAAFFLLQFHEGCEVKLTPNGDPQIVVNARDWNELLTKAKAAINDGREKTTCQVSPVSSGPE